MENNRAAFGDIGMLALTWFGYLPGRTSQNIYENEQATDQERSQVLMRDLEYIHRHSAFSQTEYKDLYYIQRYRLGQNPRTLTWIAKCRSVKDRAHHRMGTYSGIGIWLSGNLVDGDSAFEILSYFDDIISKYIVDAIEAGFKFQKAADHLTSFVYNSKVIDRYSETLKEYALQSNEGINFKSNDRKICVIDLSNEGGEEIRREKIRDCLSRIQWHAAYQTYGEVYIVTSGALLQAARGISNCDIRPFGWEEQFERNLLPTQEFSPPITQELPANRIAPITAPPRAVEDRVALLETEVAEIRDSQSHYSAAAIRDLAADEFKRMERRALDKIYDEIDSLKSNFVHRNFAVRAAAVIFVMTALSISLCLLTFSYSYFKPVPSQATPQLSAELSNHDNRLRALEEKIRSVPKETGNGTNDQKSVLDQSISSILESIKQIEANKQNLDNLDPKALDDFAKDLRAQITKHCKNLRLKLSSCGA